MHGGSYKMNDAKCDLIHPNGVKEKNYYDIAEFINQKERWNGFPST
jgi:hypothetical protein